MVGTTRRLTAALTLIIALLTPQVALCAGWSPSPADRMACCKRAGHSCGSVSADDCCADGEQRQNSERLTALVIEPPVRDAAPIAPLTSLQYSNGPITLPACDGQHIHLLDSVFRI